MMNAQYQVVMVQGFDRAECLAMAAQLMAKGYDVEIVIDEAPATSKPALTVIEGGANPSAAAEFNMAA